MNQLTIGQRIASQRKLRNLSQEDLAQQLAVSRQAVSKWESDAAIPEIDKLIALSKLFEVSVGWILGVEAQTDAAFTDAQLQTVEQLITSYRPTKRGLLLRITAFVCVLAVIIAAFSYLGHHIAQLNESNQTMHERISALNTDNDALKGQISQLNDLVNQQNTGKQLLSNIQLSVFADNTLENIHTTYYFTPKVYLPMNTAYLSIVNPATGYNEMVECVWSEHNAWYVAKFSIPAEDGYKFTFLLVNDYGYEEENLLLRDPGIAYLGTYCHFHLSPSNPDFIPLQLGEADEIGSEARIYTFNEEVFTPHIFDKTVVAFSSIDLILKLNDEVIWEKSYLEEFKKVVDVPSINGRDNPVLPDVSVTLPQLKPGDKLMLILTAETVNGGAPTQQYETILDYCIVTQ